jgi:integrase/recombinase XerD
LHQFTGYIAAQESFSFFAAKEEDAFTWREELLAGGLQPLTVSKKLLCVHAFYEWLHECGYLLVNPLPKPSFAGLHRLPRQLPDSSTLHRAYCKLRTSESLPEQRDYVALDLGYSCGLRRCELHALNLQDITPDDPAQGGGGTVRVKGKGGRERLVPVGPNTLKDLLHYIYHIRPKLMKGGTTAALFVSWQKGGTRMNIRSFNRAFSRIRRKYGLDRSLTPHGLRHAFGTDMVKNGAPVQDVSKMLGHKKLETTQIYTHLAARDLKQHHQNHHPRG